MLKRFLWAGLAAAFAVTVVAGASVAGSQSSQAKTTLRVAIGAEPPSLDPGLATDTTSANLLFNLMDPLIRLGNPPALKATPGAASGWSVKGANVTLTLRRNVKWSNGKPVTAADYVWSWLRTISPELGADYAYQFYGIKGAEAYNSCKSNCGALRSKVGIKAAGAYKLKIQLTSPQPWFMQQLAHTSFLPVNKAAVTKHGKKWQHRHQRPVQAVFVEARRFDHAGQEQRLAWREVGQADEDRASDHRRRHDRRERLQRGER
jgi:oligopeptide transport system substrate-binding protein